MSAADNYEAANLKEQQEAKRQARQTITVAAALVLYVAAVTVAVLAAITTTNIMDILQTAKLARCT